MDFDGRERLIDIDREALISPTTVVKALMANGLRPLSDKADKVIAGILCAVKPEKQIIIVSRTGFHTLHDGTLIHVSPNGDVVNAPDHVEVELASAANAQVALSMGTLEGWQETVSTVAQIEGCPHWSFAHAASFGGVLVELLKLDTCGIHLSGQSSGGKTTAQRLATSTWSIPDEKSEQSLMNSWRTTDNAIEMLAAMSHGTILVLDEISHADGQIVGRALYTLAGGTSKSRMSLNGGKPGMFGGVSWRTLLISSGEVSLSTKVKEAKTKWQAGMTVRFADIDITDINRMVDKATMTKIEDGIKQDYGLAGPAFIRYLFDQGFHERHDELHRRIDDVVARLSAGQSDSMVKRAARIFAVVEVSASLAQEAGILPKVLDVAACVEWAWQSYQSSEDASILSPENMVLEELRSYVAANIGSTIRRLDEAEHGNREAAGWYDDGYVYLQPHALRQATGNRWSPKKLTQTLKQHNLIADSDEKGRGTKRYLPPIGKVSVYVLDRIALMGANDDDVEHEENEMMEMVVNSLND